MIMVMVVVVVVAMVIMLLIMLMIINAYKVVTAAVMLMTMAAMMVMTVAMQTCLPLADAVHAHLELPGVWDGTTHSDLHQTLSQRRQSAADCCLVHLLVSGTVRQWVVSLIHTHTHTSSLL